MNFSEKADDLIYHLILTQNRIKKYKSLLKVFNKSKSLSEILKGSNALG